MEYLSRNILKLNLLQLITKCDPSEVETALIAFRLISLPTTSTILVLLTITELGYILRKMQSMMTTLLDFWTLAQIQFKTQSMRDGQTNVGKEVFHMSKNMILFHVSAIIWENIKHIYDKSSCAKL